MIGQVEHGGFIGDGVVGDPKPVAVERIGDRNLQVAGIAFFAIFGKIRQPEGGGVELSRVPDDGVKTFLSAMERIGAVVLVERIFFSVELERCPADPVAVTADDGAEIGVRLVEVFSDAVIPEDNVGRVAVLVGNDQADDPGAVIGDGGGEVAVVQEVETGRLTVYGVAKIVGAGEQAGGCAGVCGGCCICGGCGGPVIPATGE